MVTSRLNNRRIILNVILLLSLFTQVFHIDSAQANFTQVKKRKSVYTSLEVKNKRIVYRKTLETSVPYIGAKSVHNSSYKGKGTVVAIIDTGANVNHSAFGGRVVTEACFTTYRSCPNKTNTQYGKGASKPVHWHGTHVSSTAAGTLGVAPEAQIISINVFDTDQSSSDQAIIRALDHVAALSATYNIASVNMSLGSSAIFNGNCDAVSPAMTQSIANLISKRIAVVVAAGNSGALGMSHPACITGVVSVAAMAENGNITSFSNLSSNTTFAAPGYQITAADSSGGTRVASGTSMASPHVAGAYALYRQIYPADTVAQATYRMQSISPYAFDPYSTIKVKSLNITNLVGAPDPGTPTTTTTLPTTTTSTTVLAIPPKPNNPFVKPYLSKVRIPFANANYFFVTYQDSFYNKSLVSNYVLACNNNLTYNISVNLNTSTTTVRINSYPSFSSCYMYANMKDGSKSANSSTVFLSY